MPRVKVRSNRRLYSIALLLLIAAAALGVAIAWRPAIAPIARPAPALFSQDLVRQGRVLAAIGNCITCHTASSTTPYAGGVPIDTPFGAIHSTNISPDPASGIGAWSEAAFARAMREGISRDGHHLYPAFPYDHYTRVSEADLHALYSFLMTREAFAAPPLANHLAFPFNVRALVAGWNLLYLDRRPLPADLAQNAQWNRGAYLVQSLGHCSACHSPRNALGAENRRAYLSGGEAEDWYAPALNVQSPSPIPWTTSALGTYLRTGLAEGHAMAGGPMQGVVHDLRDVPGAEIDAMAAYIHSVMGPPGPAQRARAAAASQRAARAAPEAALPSGTATPHTAPAAEQRVDPEEGAVLYRTACAQCHDAGRQVSSGGALPLALAVALYEPDPRSLVHLILNGIEPVPGERGRWMPGFADSLTDQQVVALASYLRRTAAAAPAWTDLNAAVAKARK